MISKSEFLNRVHGSVFLLLKKQEQERISVLKKWGIGMVILAIALTLVAFYLTGVERMMRKDTYWFLIPCATLIIPITIGQLKLTAFSDELKKKFIPILFDIFRLNLDEKEGGGLYWKGCIKDVLNEPINPEFSKIVKKFITWVKANLFTDNLTHFSYDSCFSDSEHSFSISEIKLKKGSGRSETKIFEGFVFEMNSKMELSKKILILQKLFFMNAKYFTPKKESDYEEILTEDVAFGKVFRTYIEDDKDAENVLNKPFLQKVLSLRDIYPKAVINILIENGKITITFNTDKDMFEFFRIYRSLLNDKLFEKFYDEVANLYRVRDIFKS
jgi:hypothetical protein